MNEDQVLALIKKAKAEHRFIDDALLWLSPYERRDGGWAVKVEANLPDGVVFLAYRIEDIRAIWLAVNCAGMWQMRQRRDDELGEI